MNATPEQLLAALQWRYATKKFDPAKRIPEPVWEALEQSLVLTPSSFGLQPWQFLVVENPEIRRQLQEVSWNQSQVTEASHFVVMTARDDMHAGDIGEWIGRMAEVQGIPVENLAPLQRVIASFIEGKPPESLRVWNGRQVYIALGQLMSSAALLGIDTCPMEGLDVTAYDRILGLENSGYHTAVACALGYRAADDKASLYPKTRFDRSRVIRTIA
ncbi:MAG: NAD(P)H-dependent oxidoreductase [Luteolibacter sp.]